MTLMNTLSMIGSVVSVISVIITIIQVKKAIKAKKAAEKAAQHVKNTIIQKNDFSELNSFYDKLKECIEKISPYTSSIDSGKNTSDIRNIQETIIHITNSLNVIRHRNCFNKQAQSDLDQLYLRLEKSKLNDHRNIRIAVKVLRDIADICDQSLHTWQFDFDYKNDITS